MNAASLTKTIDRRDQFYQRWSAYQSVLINRYTRMLSAKTLSKPVDDKAAEYERDAMLDGATTSTDDYDYFEEIGYGH